jgi:hypothetical protein
LDTIDLGEPLFDFDANDTSTGYDFGQPLYSSGTDNTSNTNDANTDDDRYGKPLYDPASEATCNLNCQNNGVCRVGVKNLGYIDGLTGNGPALNQTDDNFQHCVCPSGFYGIYCQEKTDPCGEGTESSCENAVNDICTLTSNQLEVAPLAFCVNGGKCKKYVTIEEE